jgi:hypothetical protein
MWYVKNGAEDTLLKGTVVMAIGAVGNSGKLVVAPLVADGTVSGRYAIGILMDDIRTGEFGFVMTQGKLRGIDTGEFTEGDTLYPDPLIPGALVNVEPASPALKLPIAFVVSSHNNGAIAVRMTQGLDLHEVHDVQITSPVNGQILRLETGVWTNWTPSYIEAETDPVFTASPAGSITTTNVSNWDSAYGWGDHALAGYLTTYENNYISDVRISEFVVTFTGQGNAFSGDVDFSELPFAPVTHNHVIAEITGLETALEGKQPVGNYITTEADPTVPAHVKSITEQNITDWDKAYDWGNHADAGYLTTYENNYISDVRLTESALEFTGNGSAFNSTVDLSTLPFAPQGSYLTAEADTLATVTGRGGSTGSLVVLYGKVTLGNNTTGTYNGNVTGLTINSTAEIRSTGVQNPPALTWHYEGLATRHLLMTSGGALNFVSPSNEASGIAVVQVNGNNIWHAGNDGDGSGLDADSVDGVHASNIVWGNAKGTNDSVTTDADGLDKTGFYTSGGFVTRPESVDNWMYIQHIKLYNDNPEYQKQIGYDTYDDRMWVRTKNSGSWTSWKEIVTSDNIGNYALTSLPAHNHDDRYYTESESDSRFVNVSGDTMSGDLTLSGYANPHITLTTTGGNYSYLELYDGSSYGYIIKNQTSATSNGVLPGSLYLYTDSSKATQIVHNGTSNAAFLSGGDVHIRGQVYVGGNGASTGTQLVYNSGTWGINITGSAGSANTSLTVTGKSSISYEAHAAGANDYNLELYSDDTGDATRYVSLRFHQGSRYWGQIRYNNAGFRLTGGADDSLNNLYAGVYYATGGNSTNWNTAYGWGNHADASYIKADSASPLTIQAETVTFTGDVTVEGTFTESSSIRFKENITPLDPALDKVNQLEAVSYNKIEVDAREIGLIAEDVAELFPEVVTYNEEGQPQGIQYQRLSVILLKAVQELSQEVNELKKKLN